MSPPRHASRTRVQQMTHPYRPRSRQPLPVAGRLSCLLLATWLLGSCASAPVADIRRAQALPESGIAGTAASRPADSVEAEAGVEPIV